MDDLHQIRLAVAALEDIDIEPWDLGIGPFTTDDLLRVLDRIGVYLRRVDLSNAAVAVDQAARRIRARP